MVLQKFVLLAVAVLVSCCFSAEVRNGERVKRYEHYFKHISNEINVEIFRDADRSLEKIFKILTAQDEKINRLQAMVVTNQFLPKCTAALKSLNLIAANKCWNDMTTEIKFFDQSNITETKVMSQLVTDSYDGDQRRLKPIVMFIKNNVEKGSDLANVGYKALIDAIINYGHLYVKNIETGSVVGSVLADSTYHTLNFIKKTAEGEASPAFAQILPAVVDSILSGKEVFIRNNVTRDFMYAPSGSDDSDTNILVDGGNGNDSRYIWKLKPAEFRWTKYNEESFYIENTFENKILAVRDGDGSLKLVDQTEESLESTWSIFYIRPVQGSSGDEVIILCSYWGIKRLGLDEKEKIPKLQESQTLEDLPTGVWHLQPKV